MINKAILLGNVGKDPEIRVTQDGKETASFSLATTDSWKDKTTGEKKNKTEWHRIVAFGGTVKVIKNYVKKGSKLYIEGKLQTRKRTDKQGVTKYTTEVIIEVYGGVLKMLDGNRDDSSQTDQPSYQELVDNNMPQKIPF